MTFVSYKIFKEFVDTNKLEKVYDYTVDDWVFGFTVVYNYKDKNGNIMAIEEDGRNRYFIESQEAEQLVTLEFVGNIIKKLQNGRN
jgi:hypothetical protein